MNLKPKAISVSGLPVCSTITTGTGTYIALTYTQVISATDITYMAQVSNDLKAWNSGAGYTGTPIVINNGNGLTQSVTVRSLTALSADPRQLMRLQVIKG